MLVMTPHGGRQARSAKTPSIKNICTLLKMARFTLIDFNEFLGCPFSDLSILEKALTAPGAEGDKEGDLDERIKYEGNRILAQIGIPLLQLAVKRLVLEGVSRGIDPHLVSPIRR